MHTTKNMSDIVVHLQGRRAGPDTRGVAEGRRTVRTTVLLPVELHAALKTIADRDRRSLHQEIIYVLEQFAAEQRDADPKRGQTAE